MTAVVFFLTSVVFKKMPAWGKSQTTETDQTAVAGRRDFLLQWGGYTLFLLVCWLPVWLAYWPGLWNYDIPMVHGVIQGVYSTHHPLIYTLLLGICYAIGKMFANENMGLILYTAIQMLVMAGIFGYVICFIRRYLRKKPMVIPVALFYGFFPVHSILALSPTKDVLFSGTITLLLVLVLKLFLDGEEKDTARDAVLRVGVCVLMLLNRNNAVYAFLIMAVFVFLSRNHFQKKKRRLTLLGLSLLLFVLFSNILKAAMRAEAGNDAEMYSVPIQQYARIHEYGEEGDRAEVEKYFDYAHAFYVPSISDPVKMWMYDGNRASFLKQSVKWIFKYPLLTLDSFLYLTKGHWDIDDRTFSDMYREMNPGDYQGFMVTHIYEGYGITRNSVLPGLAEWYTDLFVDNSIMDVPLLRNVFAPAFWHWLFVFCAMLWFRFAPRRISVYLVFFFGLLLTMLFGPCAYIRYSYPFFACAPVLVTFAFVFAGKTVTMFPACDGVFDSCG
ncbi:MAG: hypothetical protein IJP92_18140 [Lachnospiraceae bacterium]|nr:hypothetical protein [Lachnospiraceae bacterium]